MPSEYQLRMPSTIILATISRPHSSDVGTTLVAIGPLHGASITRTKTRPSFPESLISEGPNKYLRWRC